MANIARVEATITAQNALRPGLASASRDLEKFRQQQSRAVAQVQAQKTAAALVQRGASVMAAYASIQKAQESLNRFADIDRNMRRAAITGEAAESQIAAATRDVRQMAYDTAQPIDKMIDGLGSLTASGMSFADSMSALPTVAKVAQAAGSEITDIATTTSAAMENFGIKTEELDRTYDILAKGGKLGKFELKDMARYLPSILPAAKAIGLAGNEGMVKVAAMLQTIRTGTGTAEEAAGSLQNILAKMESDTTVKNFEEFGINLPKQMEKARKEGKNLLDVFLDLSNKALKGDLSKLPKLFSDMEVQRGMRPALALRSRTQQYENEIRNSAGTINADFKRVVGDQRAELDKLKEGWDAVTTAVGKSLSNMSKWAGAGEAVLKVLKGIADEVDPDSGVNKKRREAYAISQGDFRSLLPPEITLDPSLENRVAGARRADYEERSSQRGERNFGLDPLTKRNSGRRAMRSKGSAKDIRDAQQKKHDADVASGKIQTAVQRGAITVPIAELDEGDPRRKAFLAARAEAIKNDRQIGSWSDIGKFLGIGTHSGNISNAIDEHIRGVKTAADQVKPAVDGVKSSVEGIGGAGQQSASQMQSSFFAAVSAMEARAKEAAANISAAFSSIKGPSFGVGRGGLPVGGTMGEAK